MNLASSGNDKISNLDFLKGMVISIKGGAIEYVSHSMPNAKSMISDAQVAISEVDSKLRTTAADVLPKINQIRRQATMRNLINWFTSKEDEYSSDNGGGGEWDDGTDSTDPAESQISEARSNANQISGAIVESIHKSVEANVSTSANIVASVEKNTATIIAGFDRIDGSLNKILDVLTKNTAAIIETNLRSNNSSGNAIAGGKFDLSAYIDGIKKNITKTDTGSALSMGMSMLQVALTQKMAPKDVAGLLITGAMNKFAPNVGKNLSALDDAVDDVITQSLIRLGNNSGKPGIKGTLATIFGIDASRSEADTSRSEISLKSIPFDTVTKEAITSAIPGYLRKILVAVGGPDEIYDYRSRSFKSKRSIVKEFRQEATKGSIGSLASSSQKISSTLGNDTWTNMVYDLMQHYIGSEIGPYGKAEDIKKRLNDPKFVESLIINNLIGDKKASNYDRKNAKTFANRLASINDPMVYGSIVTQAAKSNLTRNANLQKYIDVADSMGVDLSFITDHNRADMSNIKRSYGRHDVSDQDKDSLISAGSDSFSSGVNYSNSALYAIFRRLDKGINVFQVGSDNSQKKKFKPFGRRMLKGPDGYKDISKDSTVDESGQGVISGMSGDAFNGGPNLLRNNIDENGEHENLTNGQRFTRWGKMRGKQLANAMVSGSPDDVKAAFLGATADVSGVASDAMKKGISAINEKFGNISGYIGHKMFGSEYTYNEIDPKTGKTIATTIGKNEKGGVFGFVTDKVKSMFSIGREKANNWFSDVAGYFDYGEKDKDNKGDVVSKRKKLMHASVGAMAGAGLLGGPVGIIMGAVAGNAIGQIPNIGDKLKEKLFGKDKETGKPTGLLSKMGDAIITPMQYQFGKTMNFVGNKLKKNLLGPLSDIGFVLKNRITSKVSGIFGSFFSKMLHGGAKLLGGIGKAGSALLGGIINARGTATRGKVGAVSGITGFGLKRISDILTVGTPGLHGKLKDRRNAREEELSQADNKFSSLSEFRKQKWDKNKNDMALLEKYTEENVIATKEINDSNSEIASNTSRTVELLTDIKNSLNGNHESGGESGESVVYGMSESNDNIVQFPGNKSNTNKSNTLERSDNSDYGERLISAGTTAAALSGFSESETKDLEDINQAANRGESKGTIFGKFKSLLKKNKEDADDAKQNAEKEKDSLIDKIFGGIGNIIGKYWPWILGGLALFNEKFREVLFEVGECLLKKLPGVLGKGLETLTTYGDAATKGAKVVKDPVDNKNKGVVSAEEHNSDVETGLFKASLEETSHPYSIVRNGVMSFGQNAITNTAASTINGGIMVQKAAKTVINLPGAIDRTVASVHAGVDAYRTARAGGSGVAGGLKAYSQGKAAYKAGLQLPADNPSHLVKTMNAYRGWNTVAGKVGSLAAGYLINKGLDFGNRLQEKELHRNYLGSYYNGTSAGGYRTTDSTKVAIADAVVGTALLTGVKFGSAAIAAAVGCPLAAPAIILTAVATAAAFLIGMLITWLVDKSQTKRDEDYAVNTNALRLSHVIKGGIDYSSSNPIYAYCPKDSDRILGMDAGVFIRDPEITFGQLLSALVEDYTTNSKVGCPEYAGTEVLLYEWICHMAYQGVPWAVYIAGNSKSAKASSKHGNSSIWDEYETNGSTTSSAGLLWRYDTIQIKQRNVEESIDVIMADIQAGMKAKGAGDKLWDLNDLRDVYNAGKEVYDALRGKGILTSKGKIETKKFKGSYNSGKDDSGWKDLLALGKSNGYYFVIKCLVFIDAHVDVKDNQRWIELKNDDATALLTELNPDHNEDAEISQDDSHSKAHGEVSKDMSKKYDWDGESLARDVASAITSYSTGELGSLIDEGTLTVKDLRGINNQIKYITAGWAFAHPKTMTAWLSKKDQSFQSSLGIQPADLRDNVFVNWENADSRVREIHLNHLRDASVKFAEEYGDIFGLARKINWAGFKAGAGSRGVGFMGSKPSMTDKYGASVILKNDVSQGPSVGNYLTDMYDEYYADRTTVPTPHEVHGMLFGSALHDTGLEDPSSQSYNYDQINSSLLGRISKNIWFYPSSDMIEKAGASSFSNPFGYSDVQDYLRSMNLNSPQNLPSDVAVGGEVDPSAELSKFDGALSGASVAESAKEKEFNSGGNPLVGKNFRITSGFGATKGRPHSGAHKGVDLVPSDGSGQAEVGSRFNGTVLSVKRDIPDSVRAKKINGSWKFPYDKSKSSGNMVSIQTDNGMIVKNMHLKAGSIPSNIVPGAHINIGDRIGTMGSTGWSTGNHLHYEFRGPGDELLDPTDSLSGVSDWSADASVPTYVPTSSDMGVQENSQDTISSDGSGSLMSFIDELKSIGSSFLYSITGGLIGSNGSTENDSTKGSSDISKNGYSANLTPTLGAMNDGTYLTGGSNSNWLKVVREVKQLVANQHPGYNQSNLIPITYNGKTLKVRTDCTGIICAMLKFYGVMDDGANLNSSAMLKPGAIKKGFDLADFPGWDKLVEGDILVTDGHAEIFAKNDGSTHYVYNGGSTKALCSPGATKSSHKTYQKIWRCREQAKTAVSIADPSKITGSGPDVLYKKLTNLGYSEASASGVMGVWQAESGNDSKTVEGDYIKGYPGYNTVMADNNSLNTYYQDFLVPAYKRSNISIKDAQYKGEDGNYYPGIGLAQWTGPRHYNLKKWADSKGKDWRDQDTQLAFMEYEKGSRHISDEFKQMENPEQAAEIFARNYEGTKNKNALNKRAKYAKEFYEKYKGSNASANAAVVDPLANTDGMGGDIGSSGKTASISASSIGISRYKQSGRKIYTNQQILDGSVTSSKPLYGSATRDIQTMPQVRHNDEDVVNLLKDVLTELRCISGNTGNSNTLLKTIGEKGIVDKDLRNQLGSLKPRNPGGKTHYTTKGPNSAANTRMISSMIRP